MKYGFVYETVNILNDTRYIGKHKRSQNPNDPDDSWYLGSGVHLVRAIEKYGVENFTRRILCECDSEEELREKEKHYIKLYNAVESPKYYNICLDANPPAKLNSGSFTTGHKPWNYGKSTSKTTKERQSKSASQRLKDPKNHPMYGKHQSEESKRLMSVHKQGMKFSEAVIQSRIDNWSKHHMKNRVCVVCQGEFIGGPRAKLCSHECALIARRNGGVKNFE